MLAGGDRRRKLKGLELWHHSWWSILTEARLLHDGGQISDPLARWLVGELIAYLSEPASGIESFRDLGGSSWVAARDAIRHQTLRPATRKQRTSLPAGCGSTTTSRSSSRRTSASA